jgi:hypothetical protein
MLNDETYPIVRISWVIVNFSFKPSPSIPAYTEGGADESRLVIDSDGMKFLLKDPNSNPYVEFYGVILLIRVDTGSLFLDTESLIEDIGFSIEIPLSFLK